MAQRTCNDVWYYTTMYGIIQVNDVWYYTMSVYTNELKFVKFFLPSMNLLRIQIFFYCNINSV